MDDFDEISESLAWQSELEKRGEYPTKPTDPILGMVEAIRLMREDQLELVRNQDTLARATMALHQKVEQIEMVAERTRDEMSLRAFVNDYRPEGVGTSAQELSAWGTRIKRWHEQNNLHYWRKGTWSEDYGRVNKYSAKNLFRYFKESGIEIRNLQRYMTDQGL